MRLDLDSGLFLAFRTSWLLWSQLGSANWSKHCFVIALKLVTKVPDVFLCERALNSTVVRLCHKGLGWSVTLECFNSHNVCGFGQITSEVVGAELAFRAGSFPQRLPALLCSAKESPWHRQCYQSQQSPASLCTLHASTLQDGIRSAGLHWCIGFNQSIFTNL